MLSEELAQLVVHRSVVCQEKEQEKQKAKEEEKQKAMVKEERMQQQLKDLQETLQKMEEKALKLEETQEEIKKEKEKPLSQDKKDIAKEEAQARLEIKLEREIKERLKAKKVKEERNPNLNPTSNPNSTTPDAMRNQYYRGPGESRRVQNAGGYGGGDGDDPSDSSDDEERGELNSDREYDREGDEDEDDENENYGGNTHNYVDEAAEEEEAEAAGNFIKRNIIKSRFNQADYITPKCLKTKKISSALDYFASKEALTRNDLNNVNGAYGKSKKKPQYSLRVAPWFEKKYKSIMKDIGMPNAADEEMIVWFLAWREARKDGEWHSDDVRLQISNGYDQLIETKFQQLKNLLDGAPVLKGRAHAKKLTPQDVRKWMQKGRVYCLRRAIYWKTFHKFMVTSHTLHPEIKEAVDRRISTNTFSTEGAWTISVYIESIILEMLDPEESFDEMEDRLVEKHVRALHKEESTTQLRAELEDDALQLSYVDPAYILGKKKGKGFMNEVSRKDKMQGIRQRLLVSILKTADYYVDLNEMYSYRDPSTIVEKEEERQVIFDLAKLMKTKKARQLKNAEAQVYSTQPKHRNLQEKAMQMKITQLESQQQQLVHKLKEKLGGTPKPRKDPKGVGLNIPSSGFKHPCHKCESKPGTDRERKEECNQSHHCRIHDGETMCTKSPACRLRTEKVKELRKFKEKSIPKKASKATINQIMEFTEEDIKMMPADRPCTRGEHCLQETGGTHSRVCRAQMAEIEAVLGDGPDLTKPGALRQELEEQEDWNLNRKEEWNIPQNSNSYDIDYILSLEDGGQEQGEDTDN